MLFPLPGELAEWSKAAVLKTVDPQGSGGSNPSLSANFSIWLRIVVKWKGSLNLRGFEPPDINQPGSTTERSEGEHRRVAAMAPEG